MQAWAERFPDLYAPGYWPWGELDVRFGAEQPPDELISNAHVIGRTEGGIVVCANDLGWRFLPGGTREPTRRSRTSSSASSWKRPAPASPAR